MRAVRTANVALDAAAARAVRDPSYAARWPDDAFLVFDAPEGAFEVAVSLRPENAQGAVEFGIVDAAAVEIGPASAVAKIAEAEAAVQAAKQAVDAAQHEVERATTALSAGGYHDRLLVAQSHPKVATALKARAQTAAAQQKAHTS